MIRLLHTADWHLGHRLYDRERTEEQSRFLNWLVATIRERGVEALVVAGDVFDSMNPSNTARDLYYSFLGRLRETECRNVIIVAGNHDSPSLIDAPAELFRHFNIHVIGGARPELRDQLCILYDRRGQPAALVAAVPYLRDRDLDYTVVGEQVADRISRLKAGIRDHYEQLGGAAGEERKKLSVGSTESPVLPVVATGHLFASGARDAVDKLSKIYLADESNIEAGHFPDIFDYVALGHVHMAQRVGGQEHVRYSGSPVPLTFGEATMRQGVVLVELDRAGQPPNVETLPVPVCRRLISLRGEVAQVRLQLAELVERQRSASPDPTGLRPWVEVRVISTVPIPLLRQELQDILAPTAADPDDENYLPQLIRFALERPADYEREADRLEGRRLDQLRPEEVFFELCHQGADAEREDYDGLLGSFRELRGWMEERQGA